MKKNIMTLVLIIVSLNLIAQCDRGFVKSYQGTIIRKTIDDTTIVNIFFPSDFIFVNESKSRKTRSDKSSRVSYTQEKFSLSERQNSFSATSTFLGSCRGEAEDYLKSVFIEGVQKYKITIATNLRSCEIILDIDKIEFKIIENKIQIILPTIEI